jgi:hypothetical protein
MAARRGTFAKVATAVLPSSILIAASGFFLLSFWLHYPGLNPTNRSDLLGSFWPRIINSIEAGHGITPYVDYNLEYPAVSGWLLWIASLGRNVYSFYFAMSGFLFLFMLVGLYATGKTILLQGRSLSSLERFVIFTPVFIYYSIYSFDWTGAALLAVSIYFAYRDNDLASGAAMGLAIAARVIPILCLPFILLSFKGARKRVKFLGLAVVAWLIPNLYFLVVSFNGFLYAYTFQAGYASEDSWLNAIPNLTVAKLVSAALLAGMLLLLLRWRKRFDLSELCLISVLWFFVADFKFPPQYMILALPLFAMVGGLGGGEGGIGEGRGGGSRNYGLFMLVNVLDVMLILWYTTPSLSLGNPVVITSPVQWISIARQALLLPVIASLIIRRLRHPKEITATAAARSTAPEGERQAPPSFLPLQPAPNDDAERRLVFLHETQRSPSRWAGDGIQEKTGARGGIRTHERLNERISHPVE